MKTIITSLIITLILCLYIRGYIIAEDYDFSEESRKYFQELYFSNLTPKGLKLILDRALICLILLVIFLCYKGVI